MEDKEISNDPAVYMGFSTEELKRLDKAVRTSLIEALDSISDHATSGSADVILQRLEDALETATLLRRVASMMCIAYEAEEKKEDQK